MPEQPATSTTTPAQQRVIISRRGGPEVLTLVNEPVPEPGAGEVRLRVLATGVAFADVLMREGLYPGTPRYPFAPGYDVVGDVDAVGAGVDASLMGKRMAALTVTGGYARYIIVPAEDCVAVPDGLDPAAAVSLILNYLTAYQMLHRVAAVTKGSRILVHGAAGGAGSALVELGIIAGCTVYGTASKAKHPAIAKLGATPIDYRRENFVTRIRKLTNGGGVDAVFDPIGGGHWRRSFKTLRNTGVLVAYGASGTTRNGRRNVWNILGFLARMPRWSPLSLMSTSRGVHGFNVTLWKRARPDLYRIDLAALLAMLAEGKIAPLVAARLPLARAAEAHAMLNNASVTGKIVLEPWA
jgi:NADPH:quinone reductase-like Zn-dependent oxidoreductase